MFKEFTESWIYINLHMIIMNNESLTIIIFNNNNNNINYL